MKRQTLLAFSAALLVGTIGTPATAQAQNFDDQQRAREEMRAGMVMPAREIESQIVPRYERQGYEYLNFEYDARARAYRLKFIREGRVTFVDVDARTGRVIRRRR